jgi:hypothetical protein
MLLLIQTTKLHASIPTKLLPQKLMLNRLRDKKKEKKKKKRLRDTRARMDDIF